MNGATTSAQAEDQACYVYGVVPDAAPKPADAAPGVGNPPSPVTLIHHGEVAALVSEIDPEAPLGSPDDLRAHAEVLDTAAKRGPVLPFRFGGVVRDAQAVTDELLDPFEERFAAALEDLDGRAQFAVRGAYRQGRILQEILADRPEIADLNARTKALPEEAGRYERIRLGEMVAQEMAARSAADSRALLERLAPLAVATSDGAPAADLAVDASFLVDPGRREEFEAAVEELAGVWAGRIDLRLLGPLAPYDFVTGLIERTVEAS
ncbi:GvpL/GvpF family gas vesicle protein [Catenulispora subtropica]|uniref:GvpL/GvpF family gas vesicle protein n=1 Tax=Catenulispora subtropica TaxID=450798 RepID=A0ABP5D2J8_9ACTN